MISCCHIYMYDVMLSHIYDVMLSQTYDVMLPQIYDVMLSQIYDVMLPHLNNGHQLFTRLAYPKYALISS